MPDITMCANSEQCPKKYCCFRHTAIAYTYQSFAFFYKPDEECKNFYPRAAEKCQ